MKRETKLFNRSDVQKLMSLPEHIEVVENAYKLHAEGKILTPDLLHIDAEHGEFHVKAGGITEPKTYFGLKCNGGFFQNKIKYGLPNIQGLILLYDGDNGSPLAIFESGDITIKRTGAATTVAAKYLAVENADTVSICGCGIQGRIQLKSLMEVRPVKNVFAWDLNHEIAQKFASDVSTETGISVTAVDDISKAFEESQVVVTCTPAHEFFFKHEYSRPGMFIAAVGADSPEKQELDPELFRGNKVIADILEQCLHVGELHHAVEAGTSSKEQVHGELGELVTGKISGRQTDDEIIIFDATGTALQDVACAAYIYEKSLKSDGLNAFEFPG